MKTTFTPINLAFLEKRKQYGSILASIIMVVTFVFGNSNAFSQITFTNPNISPSYAVTDVLLGTGVAATNITFNGSPFIANNPQNSVREFTNTSAAFPLSNGVLMQTNGAGVVADPDLSAITTNTVTNGAIIEFDFIPDGDSLSFSYIFTSAEYSSFTCSSFNDVFGFFISGPGISGPYSNNSQNIAIIPGSNNIPVGINTLNSGVATGGSSANCSNLNPNWIANSAFFTTSYNSVYNSSPAITANYNGSTVELTANATVICGEVYHIKLAIANVMDQSFDSGVFLKAGSFASTPMIDLSTSNTSSSFSDSVIVEGCHQGNFCFDRTLALSTDTAVVHYEISGSAILGVDYTFANLPNTGDSIVLLPGDTSLCIDVLPIDDGISEGPESIILTTFAVNACGDTTFNTAVLWIADTPAELMTDAGPDFVVCSGGLGTMSGTATTSTNDIAWTYAGPGVVNFTPNNEDVNADVSFSAPGTYTMFLTESNDSCNLMKIDSVTVIYEELTLSVSNDTTVCENGEATIVANAIGGISFEYNWSHTANLNGVQTILPTAQADYTVFAESSNGCVTPTETINVDVLPPITLTSTVTKTICPGETTNVVATATGGNGGPYTYVWTDEAGVAVGAGSVINVSPTVTTVYTVSVTDDCETTEKISTTEIVVADIPEIEFDVVDPALCTPAEFVLFNQTDANLVQETYWYISDGQTFMGNDTINVMISAAGAYKVQMVVVTIDGCVDSASVNSMLTVYPKPQADFTYYPRPATILNTEVNFQNYSEDASTYEWFFEGGTPIFSSLETPKTKYPEGEIGTYEVELVAVSEFNCRDTIRKIVEVIPEVLIFAPNTFTPDNDELNPTWKPIIEGIDKMNVTVEIFNRWGEKVFETHDINYGWDGTYGMGGSLVKTGTYIWKIKASDLINDNKHEWEGIVTVLY